MNGMLIIQALLNAIYKKRIIEVFRMSGYSGWFDPICYQFYFYNVNSIGFAPEMNMAYRSFLEEIKNSRIFLSAAR